MKRTRAAMLVDLQGRTHSVDEGWAKAFITGGDRMANRQAMPKTVRRTHPLVKLEDGRHWYQGIQAMVVLGIYADAVTH